MAKIYLGTSGWQYKHWRGVFYPEKLPQTKWLEFYAKHFNAVEVNSTFYRLPNKEVIKKWQKQTPGDFIFSIKANRFITHIKRLKGCQEAVENFFNNLTLLTKHRSLITNYHVILWQLPPSLKKDIPRLGWFLGLLPNSFRHAFEFRHSSWLDRKVLELFRNQKNLELSIVFQDWHEWPVFKHPADNFVYIRLHGVRELYAGNYSDSQLEKWALKMQQWKGRGLDIYVFFNNDAMGYAAQNALALREKLTI